MDRLTISEIETMREVFRKYWEGAGHTPEAPNALCDMARQSLSQEAARDEALEVAVRKYLKEQGDEAWWTASERRLAIALKREPNAALGMEHPNAASAGPAPVAPVAEVAKRLRSWAYAHPGNVPEDGSLLMEEAAALLAKLGQGWVPVSEGRPQNSRPVLIQWYDGDSDGMLVAQYNGIRWTYDGGIVPPSTEVTHWMPLPKSPGASDD